MSTSAEGTIRDDHDKLEILTDRLRDEGIAFEPVNTGGGYMVVFVDAGTRQITISDDSADPLEYLAVDHPDHESFWNDEGDMIGAEVYDDIALDDLVAKIRKVTAENPVGEGAAEAPSEPEQPSLEVRHENADTTLISVERSDVIDAVAALSSFAAEYRREARSRKCGGENLKAHRAYLRQGAAVYDAAAARLQQATERRSPLGWWVWMRDGQEVSVRYGSAQDANEGWTANADLMQVPR